MVQNDIPESGSTATNAIQSALQGLWEKAQQAADRIRDLREENTSLRGKLEELETKVREQEALLIDKEQKLKELQEKSRMPSSVDVGDGLLYLSPDEREALERQMTDLIARINAHLGSDDR